MTPEQLGYTDPEDPEYIKAVKLQEAFLLCAQALKNDPQLKAVWTSNFRVNIMAAWQINNKILDKDRQWFFVNCQKAAEWCIASITSSAPK